MYYTFCQIVERVCVRMQVQSYVVAVYIRSVVYTISMLWIHSASMCLSNIICWKNGARWRCMCADIHVPTVYNFKVNFFSSIRRFKWNDLLLVCVSVCETVLARCIYKLLYIRPTARSHVRTYTHGRYMNRLPNNFGIGIYAIAIAIWCAWYTYCI